MAVTLSTVSSVTINDLGVRTFTHPLVNYELTSEYTYQEIRESSDLGIELDAGNVTILNDGVNVANSSELKNVQPKQTAATSEAIIQVGVDPTANDDNTLGYFVGQRWINTITDRSYIAIDVSTGAAIWKEITGIEGIETGSNGEIILNSGVSLGTAVTPPILNANTNNLVIAGIETAIVVRLSTSGNYSLTGIEPKDDATAWMLFIANVGTNNIALKNNDANSLAENRFLIGGDKTIQSDEGILLFYDPVTKRWRGSGILI